MLSPLKKQRKSKLSSILTPINSSWSFKLTMIPLESHIMENMDCTFLMIKIKKSIKFKHLKARFTIFHGLRRERVL
jgi:hypothetical protein